jgi:hypothetical protein
MSNETDNSDRENDLAWVNAVIEAYENYINIFNKCSPEVQDILRNEYGIEL